MDFAIDADTQLLLETVDRFVRERLQPLEAAVEATGASAPAIAAAIFTEARTLGLYGMNMPEICGGGGLSTVQMCLVEERLGHTKDVLIRRAFGNVYEVLLACEGPQVKRWLEPAVAGERVCSIAIIEPSAGSDAREIAIDGASTATSISSATLIFRIFLLCLHKQTHPNWPDGLRCF